MTVRDLGTMRYREAWALQEQAHAEVLAGGDEHLFLVEHPPVITLGRRPGLSKNILAATALLAPPADMTRFPPTVRVRSVGVTIAPARPPMRMPPENRSAGVSRASRR